ncbi:hypothetical protein BVRB_1g016210 [Beta vulgaris subsp. vulgaris]|nr:hypothetical protein BVRB_1g016210 [Beta vulgaris subsp. vulgaris]
MRRTRKKSQAEYKSHFGHNTNIHNRKKKQSVIQFREGNKKMKSF